MQTETWMLIGFVLIIVLLIAVFWVLAKWYKEKLDENYVRRVK